MEGFKIQKMYENDFRADSCYSHAFLGFRTTKEKKTQKISISNCMGAHSVTSKRNVHFIFSKISIDFLRDRYNKSIFYHLIAPSEKQICFKNITLTQK